MLTFKRGSFVALFLGLLLIVAGNLVGCKPESAQDKNLKAQTSIMEKATAKVPVPNVNNFLTRQYIAEWMKRMDDPSKVFYIYLFADTGNPVGYYVGTRPVSLCTLMTPPKKFWSKYHAGTLGPAPTLSGVYGSGGGGCDTYYFFDEASDALVHFGSFKYVVSDEPLGIEADPIQVTSN